MSKKKYSVITPFDTFEGLQNAIKKTVHQQRKFKDSPEFELTFVPFESNDDDPLGQIGYFGGTFASELGLKDEFLGDLKEGVSEIAPDDFI